MLDGIVDVSIIIPSTGRPELRRAITSVLRQNYAGHMEIIVVFDLAVDSVHDGVRDLAEGATSLLFTGGGMRGGYARNLGVRNARGEWIAFLDDDDEWMPEKLKCQFDLLRNHDRPAGNPVIGSRIVQMFADTSRRRITTGIPAVLIAQNQNLASYLFSRRRPGARRASFFTSTILAKRTLCTQIPWNEDLNRHQDWDWLIRAGHEPSTYFLQTDEQLVNIFVGSAGSLSAGSDWSSSLKWAEATLCTEGGRPYSDFLTAQTLRYALQGRDARGVLEVVGRIFGTRTIPSLGPLIIGLSGILPRRTIQRLLSVIK
ncbi:glycosyltransferase family 2 protein [Arthrobacter sp. A5]|uniref:glycosyltransferase family 2 protein n=1 Tax=Arthrobacter sp. A5 TaxID=576926 RepID=UPI003DA91C85